MTDQPTLATLTEEQLADLIAEATAFRNQPSLRHCLYPGCLREFDMAARMDGREPARPSWSGAGWRQVTRGPSTGSVCPDHVGIVTEHLPRTVDVPNGRWMVACACGWMSRSQTYGGLLRPLWEEHLLLAAGELAVPVTLAETPSRLSLDEHTEASLAELYEVLEDTENDRAETREAAQAMYKAWDWHRNTFSGIARAVNAVCNMMRVGVGDTRDWSADRHDAYLWGVLIGWDDDTLKNVAARHRWNEHRIHYVREMRALLSPITDPQKQEASE
ncbi:hypothetical protein [Streptomyces sp. x-45]|uniref:hypothetical protein n=1 Tax=Streptomyces sp. x-45 TaxID=2789281 RepID=UPI00397F3A7E